MGASLDVVGVTVRFGDRIVLDAVSLSVAAGEIVALLGPSGSGKSTLLKAIAGIIVPESGSVRIGEADVTRVPTHRRHIGLVFQDNQLFPHRSVIDNVAFGLQMEGVERRTRHRRAAEWLERVGLDGFASREVSALSGGESKRVALARTMITEPVVVLLDEPLTGLDRALHDRLAADLRNVLTDAGTTALLVTHDQDEAAMIAARSVELRDVAAGSPTRLEPTRLEPTRLEPTRLEPTRLEVVELAASDTYDLRRRVLRASTPSAEVTFGGDDLATTVHLGIAIEGGVVAVSTWLRAPFADRPEADAVQLRGMATEPTMQGRGLGAMLLAAGLERARTDGAELVWARARSTALAFYLAHGFVAVGDEFVDGTTGLPHVVVVHDPTD